MRCEEARSLLPAFAGEEEPFPHELEVHLATCRHCAAEEGRYRSVMEAVVALGPGAEEPSPHFVDAVMALVARPSYAVRTRARRLAHDPRARYAAASLGGAVVGAAAIAILLRRASKRAAAA